MPQDHYVAGCQSETVEKLRRDLQATQESANPHHESPGPHIDIQAPLEWIVNGRQRQRSAQGAVKPSAQQTAKSDERGGAAKSQAGDDEDETEAEHNPPQLLAQQPRPCATLSATGLWEERRDRTAQLFSRFASPPSGP